MRENVKRVVISVILFVAVLLVFTRIDYLIHHELYENGLVYDDSWFWTSQVVYMLMYQLAIIMLYLYSESKRLFIIFEAFVWTGGMDLIGYFLVWNGGVLPNPQTIWTWNILHYLFGFPWNIYWNITFTTLGTLSAFYYAYHHIEK